MEDFKELRELLQEIHKDVAILKEMYNLTNNQKQKEEKGVCEGVTGKGTPCKNSAVEGEKFCRMHGREKTEVKKTRTKREAKPKKIQPEHNHAIGEITDVVCPLCETHGDVLDPELPNATFEGEDITEKLRKLIEDEL